MTVAKTRCDWPVQVILFNHYYIVKAHLQTCDAIECWTPEFASCVRYVKNARQFFLDFDQHLLVILCLLLNMTENLCNIPPEVLCFEI